MRCIPIFGHLCYTVLMLELWILVLTQYLSNISILSVEVMLSNCLLLIYVTCSCLMVTCFKSILCPWHLSFNIMYSWNKMHPILVQQFRPVSALMLIFSIELMHPWFKSINNPPLSLGRLPPTRQLTPIVHHRGVGHHVLPQILLPWLLAMGHCCGTPYFNLR